MRFLILSTDYPESLEWLYAQRPGLERASYEEQVAARYQSLLGSSDFYAVNLHRLGHEAYDINVNNVPMQSAWAREHGIKDSDLRWQFRLRKGVVPWLSRVSDRQWSSDVLAAQIKYYKPDILFTLDMQIGNDVFKRIKPEVRL